MFKLSNSLPLLALALASACSPNTSTVGQRITCETDPDSGVILSCEPSDGDDDNDGDDSCQDVDEDGDGQPEDEDDGDDDGAGSDDGAGGDGSDDDGVLSFTEGDGSGSDDGDDSDDGDVHDCDEDDDGLDDGDDSDDDNDGIDDDDDCDEEEGQDGDEADLPYNFEMQLGGSYTPIADAFTEKGSQPEAILSVEMEDGGAGWRLAELQSGATFTVTDADCAHVGNRDLGRDRVIVTWRSVGGGVESDHMTLRYCGQ